MKCPKCQQVYSNEFSFCLNDGSTLVPDGNLAGIDKKMSAETIVFNQQTKPAHKKFRWILLSIGITALMIFMLAGGILAIQTINNWKQQSNNRQGTDYDKDTGFVKNNQNGANKTETNSFEDSKTDDILNLEDAKTLDKLKSEGLLIVQKIDRKMTKPNPLFLMVKINPQNGDLQLNTKDVGNILAKNNLGEILNQVFKQREKDKVYVETSATNNKSTDSEIEKTVWINTKSQIKADYFYKTLDIIKKSGASPIYLEVEGKSTAENKTSGCQLTETQIALSQKINFGATSTNLLADSKTALESLAEDFKQLPPDCEIEIGNHTDNVGDKEKNVHLSFARAMAVKEFLVKLGVDRGKLSVMGYGSSEPKFPNDTSEGKEANRRTEFKLSTKN